MSNPTTPFSWQMPTATDLVTDLPADFEVFGQAVATSLADLLGGTTGQVLSKTTNADMDFTWVTTDDTNAIQNSIVDAKGDLIGATAADTPARLAVGTNGQVLTADSTAATGLAWATPESGGMTSIASGSLSGSALTLTSISGSYKDLRLVLRDYNASATGDFLVRANSVTLYTNARISTTDTAGTSVVQSSGLTNDYLFVGDSSYGSGDNNNSFMIDMYDYADTTSNKLFRSLNKYVTSGGSPINKFTSAQGSINTSSAITSFTITLSAGTFSGGTYILYGVK